MKRKLTIQQYVKQVKAAKAKCTQQQWEEGVAATRKQLAAEDAGLLKLFESTLLAIK